MRSRTLACLFLLFLLAPACKGRNASTIPAPTTPTLFAERATVLEAIESGRPQDAAAILSTAGDGADVFYLRGRLAEAQGDGPSAYRELKKAVELSPGFAEYQHELGLVAPLPMGLSLADEEARFREGGLALERAVALAPAEPRYLYARAYFLLLAPATSGGDKVAGAKLFDQVIERFPDSAWSDRVKWDRAAEAQDWTAAREHATHAGERDPAIGSRLWLLLAGSWLREEKLAETGQALEAAAKLNPAASGGFCDAGLALDAMGKEQPATGFWERCLALDPAGPKSARARERVAAAKLPSKIPL